MNIQEAIRAARERAERAKTMHRWVPIEAGEEFVGKLLGKVSYETNRFDTLEFYQFEAVAGSGVFKVGDTHVDSPPEGVLVEVPAQGHLKWFLEKNYGGEEATYLLLYTGKERNPDADPDDEGKTAYFHTYQVEKLDI